MTPVLDDLLFLLSAVPIVIFGAGATFHPQFRSLPAAARAGVAYGLGALALTVEALLFSLAQIPWSVLGLTVPLLVLSSSAGWYWRRRPVEREHFSRSTLCLVGIALGALAASSLALLFLLARGTSVDFLLFYGVKAVRFAQARGVDVELMKAPFFFHAMPAYPPVMPIVEAWGVLVAGRMPWRVAPLLSGIWFLATLLFLPSLLRRRIPAPAAMSVSAFWAAAMALSLVASFSGGNGEAPLIFFETLAGALLLTETKPDFSGRIWAGVALAGAALTKQEGILAGVLFAAGVLARDLLERRPRPFRGVLPMLLVSAAGPALWFGFRLASGMSGEIRPPSNVWMASWDQLGLVLRECRRNLGGGSSGLAWVLPAGFLLLSGKRIRTALPALVFTCGVLAVLVLTYLGQPSPNLERRVLIGWTFPRASQPPLSLWILGSGVAWFSRRDPPPLG
jgi:hypothetical protein